MQISESNGKKSNACTTTKTEKRPSRTLTKTNAERRARRHNSGWYLTLCNTIILAGSLSLLLYFFRHLFVLNCYSVDHSLLMLGK